MSQLPEFADNQSGRTLTEAIKTTIDYLDNKLEEAPNFDIATGYFNPGGYFSLADKLNKVGKVRLLLGTEPSKKDRNNHRLPGKSSGQKYQKEKVEKSLRTLDEDLKQDRNLLGFKKYINENLKELIDFFKSDRVEVRRYEKGFLHGKAYIFAGEYGVLAGSSNFTKAGLNTNLELNLGQYQPYVTEKVNDWFEKLWEKSKPYDLASLYEEQFRPYSPYLIYLRALWERYKDEIEEEKEEQEGVIRLTTFQNDGLFRAKRFLDKYNGVIIADAVGLGKTYIAGKLIEEAVRKNRQRAIVIAPAALRDGMWRNFKSEMNIHFEVISYAQLRNSSQLGGNKNIFGQEIEKYQLVIADEAHTLRNPSTNQAQALRKLLRGDPPKDFVLLTATPINNSLWDLYYLLRYFIKHDAVFSSAGITSLRDRFKEAQKQDPSDLNPNMLFDIIDQTMVRRTRHFIQEYYDNEVIETKKENIYIRFPEPVPKRVDYTFSKIIDDAYFEDVAHGLAAGNNEEAGLTLARYRPSKYIEGEQEDASDLSLIGLLRAGLLKRFESSRKAFANSLGNMINQYEAALELIEYGKFPAPEALDEWMESDNDEAFEQAFEVKNLINIDKEIINKSQLIGDLKSDIEILKRWKKNADKGTIKQDVKLKTLKETLIHIKNKAKEDAEGNKELFKQNRKVIIFSYFEDTVDWILEYLEEAVKDCDELSCYQGRIAGVAGSDNKKGISQERAIHGFAPRSTKAPPGTKDEFDILISTEVLAQGVNLQQCRNVINYDLPWNPMRVVQRNGRINRINSPYSTIYSYSFFPEERLDELLQLELRIRKKLTQAARAVGLESEVIPNSEKVEQNFADKRENIEALMAEDEEVLKQKEEAAAFSGEELRRELKEGLKEKEDEILSLPWGAGSGFKGDNPGYFFVARVGEKSFFRFISLNNGEVIDNNLTCLKNIKCNLNTERYINQEMKNGLYEAWERAKNDIYKSWQNQTDPRNLEPEIRPLFRKVAEYLRNYPPENKTQKELEKIIDSVEAPWGRRYERELREVFQNDDYEKTEKSKRLVSKIEELGLQPYTPPKPLPRINKEEIKLVSWLIIAPKT